jgi:hypothetical protein
MLSANARYALEFEVTVARAVRQGRLVPAELTDAYRLLAPANHPLLGDQRQVDLDALAAALSGLPTGFLTSQRLFVVPRLELFAHEPVPSVAFPAGRLPDGTLILECRFGHISLVNLAAGLAAITHEQEKAQKLLAAAAIDLTSPTAVAFALGVDETGLMAADQACEQALLPLLTGVAHLPEVQVHASLSTDAIGERATMRAQRVLGRLAEMGLIGRPLHLWLGSSIITECLSPYARDLRQVLSRWAGANPTLIGDDLEGANAAAGEDLAYALSHDFHRTDANLKTERTNADRSVGILRYEDDGAEFEIVDLGRVDPKVVDARLPPWQLDGIAPVLVRLALDAEDEEAHGLKALLQPLAPQLKSVSVLFDGMALSGQIGAILLPHLMVVWAGEEKLTVPGAAPLSATDVVSFADAVVTQGAVLSVPSASLLNPAGIVELAHTFGVAAISIGGSGVLRRLVDARWSGLLPTAVDVTWSLVSTRYASTGRPDLASLGAQSAVAVATLRRVLAQAEEVAPAPEEPPPDPRPKPRSGRAVRIKA